MAFVLTEDLLRDVVSEIVKQVRLVDSCDPKSSDRPVPHFTVEFAKSGQSFTDDLDAVFDAYTQQAGHVAAGSPTTDQEVAASNPAEHAPGRGLGRPSVG